ncbi:MAG TPA: 4'-phosphopantetheinyl transferase superfamily protein [Candidatus Dormibacteraeota bacterium]|nr:4'-phosphopantetheinyl transferase superfamily protein [Candidatus Dormibacteraeota bacterium]
MTEARLPRPDSDEVHLWKVALDFAPMAPTAVLETLSAEEHGHALRFRAEIDRTRYVVRRWWLRELLSAYVGTDPSELGFIRGPYGKPRLVVPDVGWLRFSLSHSAGVVAFAVATGREVGVDIEWERRDFPVDQVAWKFFTDDERSRLGRSSSVERVEAFFALWTRKEALVKLTGRGLAGSESSPSKGPLRAEATCAPSLCLPDVREWSVCGFDAGLGLAAAVAVEGDHCRVPATTRELSLAAMRGRDSARALPTVTRFGWDRVQPTGHRGNQSTGPRPGDVASL